MTGARLRGIVLGGVLLMVPFVFGAHPCAQWVCQGFVELGNSSGSITNADPTQAGRLVQDGVPSVCTPKPGILFDASARHYKVAFTSFAGAHLCLTVDVDATGCGGNQIFVAAYRTFNPANPASGVIGDTGASPSPTGSFTFPINAGESADVVVSEVVPNSGCPAYTLHRRLRQCAPPGFERGPDGRADATVFRPSDGVWYTIDSTGSPFTATQFGATTDVPTPGKYSSIPFVVLPTNLSVWRSAAAAMWFVRAPSGNLIAQQFGTAGDIPVPGDFDADGRIDYTVFRPTTGVWWSMLSTTAAVIGRPWGQNGDIPFAGDVDGDLITDHGIVRPVAGSLEWWIFRSRTQDVLGMTFGFATDKVVAADYDGDRRTDIAVWRPSNGFWYYLRSSDGGFTGFPFGGGSDIPQPSDRDGDGRADFVVFRQSPTPGQTIWYSWLSATGTLKSEPWGQMSDIPALAHNRIQ